MLRAAWPGRMSVTDSTGKTCWGDVSPLMAEYHDHEWGVPCWDDGALFERLMLESFQAGLTWEIVLKRRQTLAVAFHGWNAERIAAYGPDDVARLLTDPGIIRNRLKVEGAVKNASAFLSVQADAGSFADLVWTFVGGRPLPMPPPTSWSEVPASTAESSAMSRALKKRGFTFVGETICYAFMQSVGMVNDHLSGCPAGERIRRSGSDPSPSGAPPGRD